MVSVFFGRFFNANFKNISSLSNKNFGNVWFSTSLQLTLKDTNMCLKILSAWIYLYFYSHCHISNNRQNRGTKYIHWWTKEDPLMYGDKNNITVIIPNDAVNVWLWLLHMKYQLGIDSVVVHISIYFLSLLCRKWSNPKYTHKVVYLL